MRYVSGPSLQTLLRARETISAEETLRLAEQIGGALDAAHAAGLVHRDVKPANILLSESGDQAYLCDFGLAKQARSHGMTQTGSFFGTVDYCSPEQIEGHDVDGRADLYSLGAVLFHCLAGQPPYRRKTEFAVLEAHLRDPTPALSTARPRTARRARRRARDRYGEVPRRPLRERARARGSRSPRRSPVPTPPAERRGPRRRPPCPRRWRCDRGACRVHRVPGVGASPSPSPRPPSGRRYRRRALRDISSPPAPSTTSAVTSKLRTFVDRIENVLSQSADGRKQTVAALNAGFACRITPRTAGRRIGSVGDNRQSILAQLLGLPRRRRRRTRR